MDRIEEIQPEGVAVCQPGVRLGDLENEARKAGWELRCYPSTIIKASVGGFLGGGSGGIGTVAHGGLRDFQTVRAIEVVTMEPEPRVVLHEGEAVHEILHAWGTNEFRLSSFNCPPLLVTVVKPDTSSPIPELSI